MKKLFTNDKFFLAMVICAVLGGVLTALTNAIIGDITITYCAIMFIRLCCVVTLYISYKKHSKNVMKGMMGALLMVRLIMSIMYLSMCVIPAEKVCYPIITVLSVLLFINHFIINAEHKSSPAMVFTNQLIVIGLFFTSVVIVISCMIAYSGSMYLLADIVSIVASTGSIASIVCVESRLDAYRLDREAAGWTEEKGYPEGYVHEYEKKDNK